MLELVDLSHKPSRTKLYLLNKNFNIWTIRSGKLLTLKGIIYTLNLLLLIIIWLLMAQISLLSGLNSYYKFCFTNIMFTHTAT